MTRQVYTLQRPDAIHATDPTGFEYYGCDQNWYGSDWQKISGCGPTTASTLLLYQSKCGRIRLPLEVFTQADCLRLMETVWVHVTPTADGIYLSEQFCGGIQSFAASHGFELVCHALNIPENRMERPDFDEVLSFIRVGLSRDNPIAFLNLSNGDLEDLEEWHWVTLVALETDDEARTASVTVFDGDRSLAVDFKRWYEKTVEGGALVYFEPAQPGYQR